MLATLRQRNFALLWFAGLISMIGDWVLRIGLPLYIYSRTGSTLATGVLVIVGTAPGLVFGSVAGVFVDRWDRKRTMIIVNLLQAAILVPLLVFDIEASEWIVYVVLFVGSTLAQFFFPAEQALLPMLVDDSHLISANSLNALNGNLARLLGPALGGLIVAWGGLSGVAVVDALTFVTAAVLIAAITNQHGIKTAVGKAHLSFAAAVGRVINEWRGGLDYVRETPPLARLMAILAITNIGEGFVGTLLVPFVIQVLHGTESDYGFLLAAQAVGGIFGSLWIAQIARRTPAYRLFGISSIIFGLLDLALFVAPLFVAGMLPAVVLIALVGIPAIGLGAGFMTLMQTLSADSYRGRVFGLYGALSALLLLIGAALAGVLGESVPIVLLLTVQGVGYVVAGVLGLTVLRRSMGEARVAAAKPELGLS